MAEVVKKDLKKKKVIKQMTASGLPLMSHGEIANA